MPLLSVLNVQDHAHESLAESDEQRVVVAYETRLRLDNAHHELERRLPCLAVKLLVASRREQLGGLICVVGLEKSRLEFRNVGEVDENISGLLFQPFLEQRVSCAEDGVHERCQRLDVVLKALQA
jgi:hypothetical protein